MTYTSLVHIKFSSQLAVMRKKHISSVLPRLSFSHPSLPACVRACARAARRERAAKRRPDVNPSWRRYAAPWKTQPHTAVSLRRHWRRVKTRKRTERWTWLSFGEIVTSWLQPLTGVKYGAWIARRSVRHWLSASNLHMRRLVCCVCCR